MSAALAPAAADWVAPWMAAAVTLPLAMAALAFVAGSRFAPWIGGVTAVLLAACAAVLVGAVADGGAVRHELGGWGAPLGIEWRLDGATAAMLATTAVVAWFVAVFAIGHLPREELRGAAGRFWPPFLFLWAGLNALFLSADVFNLYVTLELVSLAAVILVTLEGEGPALTAGMRYLLVAQVGSLSYLLGVGFLYSAFGTLDIALLGRLVEPNRAAVLALTLMTAGLFAKTALFPIHVWLPPAHSAAPSPASALLSGLVVMGSFYVLLRLWFDVFPGVVTGATRQLVGALGAAAVLWGSVLALRQERVKLILAYSTVAQLGYLLLVFPLAGTVGAWAGSLYLALSHACAKAAMFLGAGLILQARGHDRLTDVRGAAQHLPMTVIALGLGGLTLMGLPPSGGFVGKWLLLTAAVESGQWWWAAVLLGGGLLAVGYVFAVLRHAFTEREQKDVFEPVPRWLELVALGLALVSVALGFTGVPVVGLLTVVAP